MQYDTGASLRLGYAGADLVTEVANPMGTILRRYVPGPGTDEPVVWYEGADMSNRRFLQADERGSIVAVTDSAGNTIATNTYDEYGIPGAGNQGRFQYTGQAWYPELGMYNYKARIYSPTLGRFMQTDPIGYGDGLNWYNYAHGDPVNSGDPTGTQDTVGTPITVTATLDPTATAPSPVPGINPAIFNTRGSGTFAAIIARWEACHHDPGCFNANCTDLSKGNATPQDDECSDPESCLIVVAKRRTPGLDEFRPLSQVPLNARGILQERILTSDGRVIVVFDRRKVVITRARNNNGTVVTLPDGSGARMMGPKPGYPNGYIVYFNNQGQPISPYSGITGSLDETHYPFDGVTLGP